MIVIIAGSRGITDIKHVELAITHSGFIITEEVSGGAPGIDRLGENWAYRNKIPITQFIPEWKKVINHRTVTDRTAGFKRNRDMGDYADAAILIHDGYSKGTLNMLEIMQRLNKPFYLLTINKG
jgi:hypothetical protein